MRQNPGLKPTSRRKRDDVKMDVETKIRMCIRTLNTVAVAGKENLDRLLGVILMLEQVLGDIQTEGNNGKNDYSQE